ncbi:hypothetical protein HZC31_08075 [Candidatus Woesearchaeota archaeon]|nr:hypothetical protein [Candidatus Woesearchaeota archaeon]
MRVIITTFFACTMKKYRKNELFAVYKTFESTMEEKQEPKAREKEENSANETFI